MSNFEFAGGLYRNEREMCAAIAEMWLSADGANDRETMLGFLAEETDEQLADETIKQWFGEFSPDEETVPNFGRSELIAAFADIRSGFDAHFPAEAA
jgi:hypothetical protein